MNTTLSLSFGEVGTDRQLYTEQCEKILQKVSYSQESEISTPDAMIYGIILSAMLKSSVEICFFLGISPDELQTRTPTKETQNELADLVNLDTRISLQVPDDNFLKSARSTMVAAYQALKITPEEFVRFARYKRYQRLSERVDARE